MPQRPPVFGGANPAAGGAKRTMGEPAMLNDYNKPPLDWIDLDDVQVQRNFFFTSFEHFFLTLFEGKTRLTVKKSQNFGLA